MLSSPAPIRVPTPRLELVAGSPTLAEAELQAPAEFAALIGASVPASWPPGEYDRAAIAFLRDRMREGGDAGAGWYAWYGVERVSGGLVVACGYFGPPADAEVEIGFSVVPEARRRGFATEAVGALVGRAFADPRVRTVRAHALRTNTASVRVLEHGGFAPTVDTNSVVEFRLGRK